MRKQAKSKNFLELRKKLPYRYSKTIAENLTGITSQQVKCVFKGEIKNPEIVLKVYEAARGLVSVTTKAKQLQTKPGSMKKSLKRA